jgi:hypothetical protein
MKSKQNLQKMVTNQSRDSVKLDEMVQPMQKSNKKSKRRGVSDDAVHDEDPVSPEGNDNDEVVEAESTERKWATPKRRERVKLDERQPVKKGFKKKAKQCQRMVLL